MATLVAGVLMLFDYRYLAAANAREGSSSNLIKELEVFSDVLALVQRDYVRTIDSRQLVEGAIKGLLATLDPHSGYLDPDFYQDVQVQTKGEFGGLGIEITIKDGMLVVVAPMEGSPAELAGIKPGDAIVKIEGKFTKEFSLVDAVKSLRGPKGTPISLSVQRKGVRDLVEVTVVRDNIQVKSVKSRALGEGYGYVRINQFMEKTTDDLKAALGKLRQDSKDKTIHGLILDLRNNPGGLLTQAIGVSDLFLSEGVIVYTDGRVEHQRQKFFARARGTEPNYPVVAVVNGGSASASEIVAGALKDHGRALVLGTQTFGKGSVQTITPLDNGGALTLTTALYYTKSGRSLQALGVVPDIVVESSEGQVELESDNAPASRATPLREGDLPGAIKNPSQPQDVSPISPIKQINKTPTIRGDLTSLDPEKGDISEILRRDRQLGRAFELLKTFNIFKGGKSLESVSASSGVQEESSPAA